MFFQQISSFRLPTVHRLYLHSVKSQNFQYFCFVEQHEDIIHEADEEDNVDKENADQDHLIDQDQVKP